MSRFQEQRFFSRRCLSAKMHTNDEIFVSLLVHFFGGKTHNVLILVVTFGQTFTVVKARP